MPSAQKFNTGTVNSIDGTVIGYHYTGEGPALILVHGSLQSSLRFSRLAKALSKNFTVYVPDRRGRGLSGPYHDGDNLLTEALDMQTMVQHTGAKHIFGLSSGAVITLKTALIETSLLKVALYEPPIRVEEELGKQISDDYINALRKGNNGKALIAVLKGIGDRSWLSRLPIFITAPILNLMMRRQAKKRSDDEVSIIDLVPTFEHDLIAVSEAQSLLEQVSSIQADVLLLGGETSPAYFKDSLTCLEMTLPHVSRFEFKAIGHSAPDNSGHPDLIAAKLLEFYKG